MAEKGKEKVTTMKLKVDLECDKCYKKVKKVLCKFPQIRDQLFDEKSNIVIIKVVCCSPEKIMDKLCSKGGGSIKTIEIVPPPKPSQPQPPKPSQPQPQAPPPKPSQPQPPPQKPKDAEKPKQQPEKPKESEKPIEPEKPKQPEKPANNPAPAPAPAPVPKPQGPPPQVIPMMPQGQRAMYYGPYYEGYGGPALNCYGMQPPQQPYECYGRPVYDSWGGGYQPPPPAYRPSHPSRCDYFTEDNPQTCSIM